MISPLSILGISSAGSSGGNPTTVPQSTDTTSQGNIPSGDLYAKGAKGVSGINYGTMAYDPQQSTKVLSELERYKNERAQMSPFDEHLQRAIAYGATYPGGQGISQLKSIQEQKQADQKAAFDMQMEIENFKAAQRQQEIFNNMKNQYFLSGGTGAGGAGGYGTAQQNAVIANMPLEVRNALATTQNKAEWDKIFNLHADVVDKLYNNPASYKQDDFYNRDTGKKERYTPLQIQRGQPQIDAQRSQVGDPNANVPISQTAHSVNPAENVIAKIHNGVLGQESSYGQVDTSKPNVQGAVGPGQFLPSTFAQYQKEGIIPKDWNVNDPEQNREASKLLLSHYYDKYNGDVNKVLAAYHGGEGAVKSDGTINLAAKDALGVTNQQYIDGVKQKAGLNQSAFANVPPTKVAGPAQPMSYGEFEVQQKAQEERLTKEAGKVGEDIGTRKNAMQTAYSNSDENLANIHDINNLALTHPKAFGVLQHPTVLSAIGEMFKSGVQDGVIGSHHISAIEDAIRRASPGISEADLTAAQEVVQKLSQLELNASKTYLKGQGAVSDNERLLISRLTGNISNSPQALRDIMAWNEARTNFDKAIGTAHDKWEDDYPNQSYRNFEKTDEYKSIKNSYKQQIDALAAKAGKYPGASGTSNLAAPKPPPGYNPNWRSLIKGIVGGNE